MLDIVYEDDYLLIVNKPAKLLTIASSNENKKTLYHQVREYLKKKSYVFIVHRLDYETSGLVIFAKNENVKYKLQNNWENVIRGYTAKVCGKVKKDKDTLINYLQESKTLRTYIAKSGKLAITEYEVVERYSNSTLVRINLKTGRKNQIRVQFANIGNPIIGDEKYGNSKNKYMLLHADYLEFFHPIYNEKIKFKIDVPKYFH